MLQNATSFISVCRDRVETPPPTPLFPSEILGMFIESLGEDLPTLRACSLVSSVFRHFCSPVLYRDIGLDCKEKADTFLQIGDRSDSLRHTKSLSLSLGYTHGGHPYGILTTISRKAPLETLRVYQVRFHGESLTTPLPDVTVLVLRECQFGMFKDFVTFIRCFPRCETLRLHGCSWDQSSYSYTEPDAVGKVSTNRLVQRFRCHWVVFNADAS